MWYQLFPLGGGRPIRLNKTDVLVGRNRAQCGLRLRQLGVSKLHARLTWSEGVLTVVDLDSSNGTWLNGKRVESAELKSGDEVAFGPCLFRIQLPKTPQANSVCKGQKRSSQRHVETTAISLEALDQMLAQANEASDQVKSKSQNGTAISWDEDDDNEAMFLTAETSADGPTDFVAPLMANAPDATDDDLVQQLFSEIDADKAKKSASKETAHRRVGSTQIVIDDSDEQDSAPHVDTSQDSTAHPTGRELAASSNTTLPIRRPTALETPRLKSTATPPVTTYSVKPRSSVTIPAWMLSRATIAGFFAAVLLMAWWLIGTGDGPTIALCQRIRNELVERRESGQTSGPAWVSFRESSTSQLNAALKRLKTSVDAHQPERQFLLLAIRDGLLVMLKNNAHWQRELSPDAQRIEQDLKRHINVVLGQSTIETEFVGSNGALPAEK